MILMLKNIDNLNNAVRDIFIEYGVECEVNFLYSQYPDPVSYTHLRAHETLR